MKYITLFQTTAAYNAATLDLPNVSLIEENINVYYNPYVPETRVVAKFNVTDTSSPTQIGKDGYMSGFSAIEIDGVVQPNVVSAYTFSATGEHTVKYTLTDSTTIGMYSFWQCNDLTSIVIPSNVTTINSFAFKECSSLSSVTIPDSVVSIGSCIFDYCTSLTNVNIPSGVTAITENMFNGCTSLTSIEIPSGVTSIGAFAFSNSGITSIVIPSGVTTIGGNTFEGCSSLATITCNALTKPNISRTTFKDIKSSGTLYVPIGSSGYDVWMRTDDYFLGKYNWTKVEQ